MRRKNGILIDIPSTRKLETNSVIKKPEYGQYNVFVTMFKREDGHNVWTMVPKAHPDFKKLIQAGYKVTETWDKRGEVK